MSNFLKSVVDFIYRVPSVKKAFESQFPDEKILASDATKGIKTIGNKSIERGADWVFSQRAVIILSEKRIKCGKFEILLENVENATMIIVSTLFGKAQILKIQTIDNEFYQFGMQDNPEWKNQTILKITFEKGVIKYSWFSIIVRVFLVVYLLFWLYRIFFK